MTNVTVWNEGLHEQRNDAVRAIYPQGIHGAIAKLLGAESEFVVRTATLSAPEHGLGEIHHIIDGLGELHAALEAALERAFAAAARVDLGFHHGQSVAGAEDFFGNRLRLIRLCRAADWSWNDIGLAVGCTGPAIVAFAVRHAPDGIDAALEDFREEEAA